ncbi:MAG: LarC family nickel insertion protein, partial [Polyangiales bacterium]
MTDGDDLGARRRLGGAIDEGASVASFGGPAIATPTIALPIETTQTIAECARVLRIEPIGGAAGDMLTAALIDLGAPEAAIASSIEALGLPGVHVEVGTRTRHAIVARGVEVIVDAPQPPRDHASIVRLLADSALPDALRSLAALTFLELAKAESKVHRVPVESVHFHEVGAVDAIVDVVAACAGLLAIEARDGAGILGISIAPIPIAGGGARGAHGAIPLPAPATLELLAGLIVTDARFAEGSRGETVTPTGAALLRAWSMARPSSSGAWPTMRPVAIGYGAGRRDFGDRANVVRLTLGEVVPSDLRTTELALLECNVDDATPEVVACAIEALMDARALDAWTQPIGMKKGRSAIMLS